MHKVQEKIPAIVIFFHRNRWERLFLASLETIYNLSVIYLSDEITKHTFEEIKQIINNRIKNGSVEQAFINVDFVEFVDARFISSIECPVKFIFSHDDATWHSRNSVTALASNVNAVIVGEPVSVLRYATLGVNAFFLPFEDFSTGGIPPYTERDIDVLFIGSTAKADRNTFLEHLSRNKVDVMVAGGETSALSYEEMSILFKRSKIVLNFSKSTNETTSSIESRYFEHVYEYKARILEAGFCGAYCVSERAPAIELLFRDRIVDTFRSPEECYAIINDLLADTQKLEEKAASFSAACNQLRPQYLTHLFQQWEHDSHKTKLRRIPTWYLRSTYGEKFYFALRYFPVRNLAFCTREILTEQVGVVIKVALLVGCPVAALLKWSQIAKKKLFAKAVISD